MATFNISSTCTIDGVTVCTNAQSLDVQSMMDYSKELSTTYAKLITNSQQPSSTFQAYLQNTGSETALIRFTDNGATTYYFTALPPGASMACPTNNGTTFWTEIAARAETGTTTLRIVALYI